MSQIGEVGDIVKTGAELVDNVHTSQEEELAFIENMHSVDMKSDSWLSKNIRPLFLVFAVFGWLMASILSAADVPVDPELIVVLERWGEFAILFYFGARGWEKVERTKMKRDVQTAKIDRKAARIERRQEKRDRN